MNPIDGSTHTKCCLRASRALRGLAAVVAFLSIVSEAPAQLDFDAPGVLAPGAVGQTLFGDLDGDSHVDVVVIQTSGAGTSACSSQILPFRNLGHGQFEARAAITPPICLGRGTLADFDGDGQLDLAATTWGGDTTYVYPGTSRGDFGLPLRLRMGRWCDQIAAADLDRDGRADLILTAQNSVIVALGDGAGGFLPPRETSVGTEHPLHLAVGDFDNDGDLDVAFDWDSACNPVFCATSGVSALLGDAHGSLGPLVPTFFEFTSSSGIASVDFDEDGRLDLAMAVGGLALLRGIGGGQFAPPQSLGIPSNGSPVAGDVNRDGHVDLAVSGTPLTANSVCTLLVLSTDGRGSWTEVRSPCSGAPVGFADVDEDGREDAVVSQSAGACVLRGDGSGGFASTRAVRTQFRPADVGVGDFAEDGFPDLLAVSSTLVGPQFSLLVANAHGGFNESTPMNGQLATETPADYDGDGHLDVAVWQRGNVPTAWLGDGRGGFRSTTSSGHGSHGRPTVDFDEDGIQDLLMTGTGRPNVVYLGNGNGSFRALDVAGLSRGGFAFAADFDADGRLDLGRLSDIGDPPSTTTFLGNGHGGFTPAIVTPLPGTPTSAAAAADFDADGRADVVYQTSGVDGRSQMLVLKSRGDGTFEAARSVPGAPPYRTALTVADVDGDGFVDLVATGLGSVSILAGDGAAHFGSPVGFATGCDPVDVVASDLDGDGDLDLALADGSDSAITILTNTSFIPYLDARAGNVNVASGQPSNVVFVNGSAGEGRERLLVVGRRVPLSIDVASPPLNPAGPTPFVLWAWPGSPTSCTANRLRHGLGFVAMPTPLTPMRSPQPTLIANTIGHPWRLGFENWPNGPTAPAPSRLLTVPRGIPRATTFFLQGVILDANGPNGVSAVTNGVLVVVP
ncbi:MAG: VCBS repeat-containing protein [Planctomycetes bacterium]|nr:VCBS repeat-containing protein [Planctomycetota bacterium]